LLKEIKNSEIERVFCCIKTRSEPRWYINIFVHIFCFFNWIQ